MNLYTLAGLDKEAVDRYLNPIKSEYRKNLESKGWEFVGNVTFKSMMDDMQPLELVWGEDIILARNSLREKMRWQREWIRENCSAKKVRFFRAYDTSGERLTIEKLAAGVYVKRVVN